MSGYNCPHCSHCTQIFSSGGGEQLAAKHGFAFLGKIPICPAFSRMVERTDTKLLEAYKECELAPKFADIIQAL